LIINYLYKFYNMKNNLKQRIKELLKDENVTINVISEFIDVPQTTLNRQINGKTEVSLNTILAIIDYFKNVSIMWLLTGEGEKFKQNFASFEKKNDDNENNSLYHYTTSENFIKILQNLNLRFSDFNNANDTKERYLFANWIWTDELKLQEYTSGNNISTEEEQKNDIRKKFRYISFCAGSSYDLEQKPMKHPRMWAQYGTKQDKNGKYKNSYMNGVCIEFNTEKIKNISQNQFKEKIELVKIEYETDDIIRNEEDSLKYKNIDWQEENEYRLLLKTDTLEDIFINISECVERIYLGADFRYDDLYRVCEILAQKRYNNIDPYIFTKIIIGENGKIERFFNNGGNIWIEMMGILYKISEEYASYIFNKHSLNKDKNTLDNYKKLVEKMIDDEKKNDAEKLKIDVEHWKNKYLNTLEEKDILNKKLLYTLEKTISLQEKVQSLHEELGEQKNELVEMVSDVKTVLQKTGTHG